MEMSNFLEKGDNMKDIIFEVKKKLRNLSFC